MTIPHAFALGARWLLPLLIFPVLAGCGQRREAPAMHIHYTCNASKERVAALIAEIPGRFRPVSGATVAHSFPAESTEATGGLIIPLGTQLVLEPAPNRTLSGRQLVPVDLRYGPNSWSWEAVPGALTGEADYVLSIRSGMYLRQWRIPREQVTVSGRSVTIVL